MSIEKGWEAIRRMQAVSDEEVTSMNADTKAVLRWNSWGGERDIQESDDGQFVLFADHEQVVKELGKDRNEWKQLADSYVEVIREIRTTLAASRAEVEGLRSVLQQIEVMAPVHGLNPRAKISDPQHVKVCWNTQLAARSALAAMEKGNV